MQVRDSWHSWDRSGRFSRSHTKPLLSRDLHDLLWICPGAAPLAPLTPKREGSWHVHAAQTWGPSAHGGGSTPSPAPAAQQELGSAPCPCPMFPTAAGRGSMCLPRSHDGLWSPHVPAPSSLGLLVEFCEPAPWPWWPWLPVLTCSPQSNGPVASAPDGSPWGWQWGGIPVPAVPHWPWLPCRC